MSKCFLASNDIFSGAVIISWSKNVCSRLNFIKLIEASKLFIFFCKFLVSFFTIDTNIKP